MSDLNHFITDAETLIELADRAIKPCVVILGSFNAGKSTLLNSLLGEEISPVGVLPTTSCVLSFDYGASFKARYDCSREKTAFHQRNHFVSYLTRVKSPGGWADIEIPCPLLKKCRLVDTPGIDSLDRDAVRLAEQAAAGADKIIYLFHQRGIEDHNRLFLYKLASIWKNRNLNDLSFWLNCNLGVCDATSLEATRAALREIFLSPVRLNILNTTDRENVKTLRMYLEVELAREIVRQASNNLKKMDGELSGRMKKVAGIKNESLFLSEFWMMWEIAQGILGAERLIHSLPSVLKEMDDNFSVMNAKNLGEGIRKPGGRPYRPKINGIKESRNALLGFISCLLAEKQIKGHVDRAKLHDLLHCIEEKRFTVTAAGGFSTGKSTFFNALLNEEILPVADGPTTASVTRITYGPQKKAAIHSPLQVTLQICTRVGDKAGLNRVELAALERWLGASSSDIAILEAYVDDHFKRVNSRELLAMINRVKELFAAGCAKRIGGSLAPPAVFRLISPKGLKGNKVLQKVRVTFKSSGVQEFDLANSTDVKAFRAAVGPDHVFRIEVVELQHPSEFLKLADFVDTPGLDWIQKHHCDKTFQSIRQSDAFLVFLNAKHVLNHMDRENFRTLLLPLMAGNFKEGISTKEEEKTFYVINFADALTPAQREAVSNFVRNTLSLSPNAGDFTKAGPKISLISALKGLTGEDIGMSSFLKKLEEGILRYHGRDFYLEKVNELYSMLDLASRTINGELLSGQPSFEKKRSLRRAQEILRVSRRKLKDIRNTINSPGRL